MVTPLRVDGVDISHHQDYRIDFGAAARAGVKWMYHKATEGDSFVDGQYAIRREQARKAGMPFGAYHFARPEKDDALREAVHFMRVARPVPGDLRPCLDLEVDEGMTLVALRAWARDFCGQVERICGVLPVIYTPYDLGSVDGLIWRPRYGSEDKPNQKPVLPWDIWQYSNGILGVPNRIAGFPGPTDLNTMRRGLTLEHLLIPGDDVNKDKKVKRIKFVHCSMQFSDSTKQQMHDARILFDRDAHIITGTEAGPGSDGLRDVLRRIGAVNGYKVYIPQAPTDTFVAVKREFIDGDWEQSYDPVIPGVAKQYAGKGVHKVAFNNNQIGRVSVFPAHYATKGREPGPRRALNRKLAHAINEAAIEAGSGPGLVFLGGDANMIDKHDDLFFGGPFTSTWDELQKWDNTGHGNIDYIASYDKDGRVKAVSARALDDSELFLHTDHFLVESVFEVRLEK